MDRYLHQTPLPEDKLYGGKRARNVCVCLCLVYLCVWQSGCSGITLAAETETPLVVSGVVLRLGLREFAKDKLDLCRLVRHKPRYFMT